MQIKKLIPAMVLIACAATGVSAFQPAKVPIQQTVTGDYVEARTASVFAGACHYNGELVTVGRDALVAWNFKGGTHQGVSLAGVKAVAAVTSTNSLGNPGERKMELAFDASATDAQVAAATALIQAKSGNELGTLVATRKTPITFTRTDAGYTVKAEKFGELNVNVKAEASCCIQPNLVWFSPLVPLEGRKVGYTELASSSSTVSDPWTRTAEDSAFYGTFSF